MRRSARVSPIAAPLAAALLVAGLSGCHWFGKKNELYTQSAETRPLEVPPDLDRPSADKAMSLPAAISAAAVWSAMASALRVVHWAGVSIFNSSGYGPALRPGR